MTRDLPATSEAFVSHFGGIRESLLVAEYLLPQQDALLLLLLVVLRDWNFLTNASHVAGGYRLRPSWVWLDQTFVPALFCSFDMVFEKGKAFARDHAYVARHCAALGEP